MTDGDAKNASRTAGGLTFWRSGMLGDGLGDSWRGSFAFSSVSPYGRSQAAERAREIASQTFADVAGISMCITPRGRKASRSALITAGGVAIAPASPMPLTPSGFVLHGISTKSVTKFGRLLA